MNNIRRFRWPLLAVSAFSLAACKKAAPDQLTVVQGTVTSATTGRPLPGVLMGVESYTRKLLGPGTPGFTGDSMRTDAQGRYELHFYNQQDLSYSISFEPSSLASYSASSRYAFLTNEEYDHTLGPGRQELTIGQTNVVNFQPDELRTVAVRIRNHDTGYQRLFFDYRRLDGNNLDTVVCLRNYYPPTGVTSFTYRKLTATGTLVKDTVVTMKMQNSGALPPDTLRATLTFMR